VATVVLAVAASPVLAHAVGLSCKLLDNLVRVEAYFSDDTPAIEALIVVKNEQGAIVGQGRTDEKGVWSFDRPAAGRYEVSVDAGAGHRAKEALTVPEPAAGSGTPPVDTGDGPAREDFTRVPWLRLAAGLAMIFVLAGCWLGRARIGRYRASRS
jgi:nickel transport protein